MARLFKVSHDEKATLGSVRILLEILLKQICKEVNLPIANNEMVGSILSKFREKTKNIVPDVVPDDIYRSMDHINGLATPGAHDKPYDPKQIREVLVALERVLHWYVVKFKQWHMPTQDAVTAASIVDIDRLPTPLTELIGREQELEQIQRAFEQSETFLAIIVAAGGIGKSALSDAWLKSIQPHYQGVQRVFAWSFYSQGAHDTQTSAAPFFQVALPFFGWTGELPKDDVAQGRALAKLLSQQRFILILDGLEPLQHPAHILDGELKDTGLNALFGAIRREGLAHSPSLILISSRQPLQELEAWETKKYVKRDLQTLPNHDGAKLLKTLGVRGTEAELQQATQEMGGHALAVVLLGKLLKEKFAGRVERRDQLPPLWEARKQGAHARRVLQFYVERYWLENTPELAFLQLLGLFDRPMGLGEKEVLVANAECAAPLRDLDDVGWEMLETHLKAAGILLSCDGFQWDCHPLIRDYFAQQFNTRHPAEFRQAHLVLFEYYQHTGSFYLSISHGCLSNQFKRALDEVYWSYIRPKNELFPHSISILGSYAQNSSTLSYFFHPEWEFKHSEISQEDKAILLLDASFCLMSLGRMRESIFPRKKSIELFVSMESWKDAALAARNLSDTYLLIGELKNSEAAARESIRYSQYTGDLFRRVSSELRLATTLHKQGIVQIDFLSEIGKIDFHSLQESTTSVFPKQYSLAGVQYRSILIDYLKEEDQLANLKNDIINSIKVSENMQWLIPKALDQLNLAKVLIKLDLNREAIFYLDNSLQYLVKLDKIQYVPLIFIERANFYLQQQQLEQAQQDLDEAWQIIERSGMKLYEVDYHLAMCRYARLQQPSEAATHLEKAKKLIQTTGYHLRDKDVSPRRCD